jgi:ubiquinol-cytochrome c reductase cytochrome c1 subunit
MSKLILILILWAFYMGDVFAAASEGVHLDYAAIDISNTASLQRGAKYYVNYCLGCHSAQYSRYKRVGDDLGLTTHQVEDNFIFTDKKVRDHMVVALRARDANTWFGKMPPDLSLIARAKGADWVYTYLRTFYLDETRPTGVNNRVLPNASMPHVLWKLQGWQKAVYESGETDAAGKPILDHLELAEPGKMTPEEYDKTVLDLVNFLVYLSEPAKLKRLQIGFWVLTFLGLFFIVAYLLKKEFWKDVH